MTSGDTVSKKKNSKNPDVVKTKIPAADDHPDVHDGLVVIAGTENASLSLNWGPDSKFQGKIADMLVQNGSTSSEIRLEIVHAIQHLLAEGEHNLDKRRDAILTQLFEILSV